MPKGKPKAKNGKTKMELTINNLIKMVIAVFVIVLIVTGLFIAMKSYVLPYFSGIGFEEPKINVNTQFGRELIQEKNLVGRVDSEGFFIYEKKKTDVYFKEGKIEVLEKGAFGWDWINPDSEIGLVGNDGKIELSGATEYSDVLEGSYKYGNEIYKVGGENE